MNKSSIVILTVASVAVSFATPVLEVSRGAANNTKFVTTSPRAKVTSVATTIECWINQPSFDGENQILNQDGFGAPGRFFFQTQNGKVAWNIGGTTKTSVKTLSANAWHHIAAVRDASGNTSFYIDGELDSTVAHSTAALSNTANDGMTIGALPRACNAGGFRGKLAELRVWTAARTGDEIKANMKRRLAGTEANLAAYWPMNEGTGTDVWEAAQGWRGKIEGTTYVKWVDDDTFPIAEVCPARKGQSSDTVAIWPLDYNDVTQSYNLKNVLGVPGTDLAAGPTLTSQDGTGWSLPPNPDAAVDTRFVGNGRLATAVKMGGAGGYGMLASSKSLGDYVTGLHPFTVEGYVKFNSLPSDNPNQFIVFSSLNGDNYKRILLMLAKHDGSMKLDLFGALLTSGADVYSDPFTAEEVVSLTNDYHHIALVYNPNLGGKAVSKVYWDGAEKISASRDAITYFSTQPANSIFEIGGRSTENNSGKFCRGAFDYWRLSKAALAPSEFLCAGGDAAAVPQSKTVHYWRLEAGDSGRASVGVNDLHGGVPRVDKTGALYPTSISLTTDHAPTPAWLGTNTGALYGQRASSYLYAENLATSLKYANAFTLEGWIKPIRTKSSPEMQVLFSTRVGVQNGWHLTFWRNKNGDGKTYLTLYASNASVLVNDVPMSGDLSSLDDWTHIALTYNPAEGKGTWRSYVGGVLAATAENAAAPTQTTGYSANLYIAGRDTDNCFFGAMDAVRVSGAALSADQLLCGANGESAPSPLALWPLDTVNGMIFNGKDLKGSYSFGQGAANFAAWSDDAPTIANPDRSVDFAGDAKTVAGSYDLSVNRKSYLGFAHADNAASFVVKREPFTLEFYVKRKNAIPNDSSYREVFLYNTIGATMNSYGTDRSLFYMMVGDKLLVNDGAWESSPTDRCFCDDTNLFPVGEWKHVAFVRTFEGANVCHELFVNGVSKGKVSGAVRASAKQAGVCMVGGRPTTDSSFNGFISSVRVSQAALKPSEFLCGEPPAAEDETILDEDVLPAGLALKGMAPLVAPFESMTLEADFTWTGVDGLIAETPQMSVAVKNGKLAVSMAGPSVGTPVFEMNDVYSLTTAGKTMLAIVFSAGGELKVYVDGSCVATGKATYVPASAAAIAGDLTLGSTATGDLRKVRLVTRALGKEELRFKPGLCIIIR